MSLVHRLHLWPLRALWVLLALLAGSPAADALDGRSSAVATTVAVLAWLGWAAALVAMLVPRALGLTVVRALVPAGAAGAAWAVVAGPGATPFGIATLATAAAVAVVAVAPVTTDAFVDGSSYGPERRLALRTPLALAVVAVVTWSLLWAAFLGGVLLVAAGELGPGLALTGVGIGLAVVGLRSLHQLSRRWIVLVPTGMVVHDPFTMPEPQLFLRQTMRRLGAATPGDVPETTQDLTAGAAGLVLELELDEPVELLVLTRGRQTTLRTVEAVRITPARPAALLAAAVEKRLPVG